MTFDWIKLRCSAAPDKPEDQDKQKKNSDRNDDKHMKGGKDKKSDTGVFKCFCICTCGLVVFKADTRCFPCENNIRHRKVPWSLGCSMTKIRF